ncbi:hypothetical protein BX600DRAFT_432279 [Xylariales sp. PMI_506]|nr:hypothetical protein BX600DRAFT_432279 [Xylariales sp. PMI_506]
MAPSSKYQALRIIPLSSFPILAILILLFLPLLPLSAAAEASSSSSSSAVPSIYDSSTTYRYVGCWNETTGLPHTAGNRALSGGVSESLAGAMTVPLCLDLCANNRSSSRPYSYAGLEYARECWCSDRLSSLSAEMGPGNCSLPCDGNISQVCGGSLRLSVYNLTSASANGGGERLGGSWGSGKGADACCVGAIVILMLVGFI